MPMAPRSAGAIPCRAYARPVDGEALSGDRYKLIPALIAALEPLILRPAPAVVPSSRQAELLEAPRTYPVVGLDPVVLIALPESVPALLPDISIPFLVPATIQVPRLGCLELVGRLTRAKA